MHFVYVLFSPQFNKIYIGYTQNLKKRVNAHNDPGNKGWTKKFQPWELSYHETFDNQSEALKREKQLKSAKGRKFIWNRLRSK